MRAVLQTTVNSKIITHGALQPQYLITDVENLAEECSLVP